MNCKALLIADLIPSASVMKNKNEAALTAAYPSLSGSVVSAFSPVRTSLAIFPSLIYLIPSSVSLSLGILASFLINYVSLTYSDVESRLMQGSVAFSFIMAITGSQIVVGIC